MGELEMKITTKGEALEQVKANGLALAHIPENLKDKELCGKAVENNVEARYNTYITNERIKDSEKNPPYSKLRYKS